MKRQLHSSNSLFYWGLECLDGDKLASGYNVES